MTEERGAIFTHEKATERFTYAETDRGKKDDTPAALRSALPCATQSSVPPFTAFHRHSQSHAPVFRLPLPLHRTSHGPFLARLINSTHRPLFRHLTCKPTRRPLLLFICLLLTFGDHQDVLCFLLFFAALVHGQLRCGSSLFCSVLLCPVLQPVLLRRPSALLPLLATNFSPEFPCFARVRSCSVFLCSAISAWLTNPDPFARSRLLQY